MNVIRRNCDVNMLFLDSSNKNMFLFNDEDIRKMLNYYNNNLIYKGLVNRYGSKYNDKNDIYFNSKQLLLYLMKYNNKDNNIDNYNKVIKRAKFNTKEEYNNFINECLNERVRNEIYRYNIDFSLKEELTYSEIALLLYFFGYLTINDKSGTFVVSSDVLKKKIDVFF